MQEEDAGAAAHHRPGAAGAASLGPEKRVTGGGRERAREAYGRRRGAAVEAAARARRKCWIWERRGKEEIREAQRDGRLGERRPRGGGHRTQRGFNYIR